MIYNSTRSNVANSEGSKICTGWSGQTLAFSCVLYYCYYFTAFAAWTPVQKGQTGSFVKISCLLLKYL